MWHSLKSSTAQSRRLESKEVKEDESEVFKHVFIPRKLEEVVEYERDIEKVQQGNNEGIYYKTIMGLTDDLTGQKRQSPTSL